jgi:hypothetical protein
VPSPYGSYGSGIQFEIGDLRFENGPRIEPGVTP